ncbi:MAG: hypothetical protein WA741_30795 [Candidatus Sulfotelmatobacter sp.]
MKISLAKMYFHAIFTALPVSAIGITRVRLRFSALLLTRPLRSRTLEVVFWFLRKVLILWHQWTPGSVKAPETTPLWNVVK